jgi:hypothetical protein
VNVEGVSAQLASRHDQSQSIWGNSSAIGDEILEQVKYINQWQKNLEATLYDIFESKNDMPLPQGAMQDTDGVQFLPWEQTPVASSIFNRLLQHLKFSEMSIRQKRVAIAHSQTFEWIFSEPPQKVIKWHNFVDWLEGDSHLYWVTGRVAARDRYFRLLYPFSPPDRAAFRTWHAKPGTCSHVVMPQRPL